MSPIQVIVIEDRLTIYGYLNIAAIRPGVRITVYNHVLVKVRYSRSLVREGLLEEAG